MAETGIRPQDMAAATAGPGPQGPAVRPAAQRGRADRWPAPGAATESRRLRWAGWLVIAVPAVTALAVGGYGIGGPSLWRDEAYTKDAISRPVSQIFSLLQHMDAVHGAYYVVMHAVAAAAGTSATALRSPSLAAMVVAAAFTAAIGRRAAALAQGRGFPGPGRQSRPGPWGLPALTGLLSGLVFATAPFMTFYAQMARPYAIETMFAAIASYLLLRAYPDGRRRWWAAYAAAVALTGLFSLFGLLILAAHAVTLLLAGPRAIAGGPGGETAGGPDGETAGGPVGQTGPGGQAADGGWAGRVPLRWLAASAAAVIVLGPLLLLESRQQQQTGWLSRPDFADVERLLTDFAGSRILVVPVALLALAGVAASRVAGRWRPLNPAAIALPWLVLPPGLLIAVSFAKPAYDVRYVEFCLPALAILVGAGLAGLVRLAGAPALRRRRLAWLPPAVAALAVLVLAVMLAGPQRAIRQTAARPDNLRLASAIVAAHEQPGDAVFYLPRTMRVLGTGYPAPFARLRDIARASSAVASGTLTGTEITSPARLKSRFTDVRRVWVVTGAGGLTFPVPHAPVDKEKMALLAGLHILHRWTAGQVMLTLYGY